MSFFCSADAAPTGEQRTLLLAALKNHVTFAVHSEEELAKLADSMTCIEVAAERDIITQGDEGDFFYVFESGRASVLIDGARVGEYTAPGSTFGELALFTPEAKRAATIRAVEACTCWRLSRDKFAAAIDVSPDSEEMKKLQEEALQAAVSQRTQQ